MSTDALKAPRDVFKKSLEASWYAKAGFPDHTPKKRNIKESPIKINEAVHSEYCPVRRFTHPKKIEETPCDYIVTFEANDVGDSITHG